MFGTLFLTILYRNFLQEGEAVGQLPFFFAFWMVTMLTVKVSGAHYNPAVTFVVMFRKENEEKFPKALGIIYIIAQFAGAFLGALLAWFLNLNGGSLMIRPGYVFQAIVIELLGSFLVFLIYIILN